MTEDEEVVAREQLGNLMIHAIKHKKENLDALLGFMEFAHKSAQGLPRFVEAIDAGKTSNEQLGQMVRVLAKTAAEQARAIRQLSTFMMILVSSQDFDKAATEAAIKTGKGDEAIRAFARTKFGPPR